MNTKKLILISFCMLFVASTALGDWDPDDPYKMHAPQEPDPFGWDVCLEDQFLGDDFECIEDGPIEDIHFWISWRYDEEGDPYTDWDISIWDDAGGMPGVLLWQLFPPYNIDVRLYGTGEQGFACPSTGQFWWPDHYMYYQVNITDIDDPFPQTAGEIYWLVIRNHNNDDPYVVGWKTSYTSYYAPAVYSVDPMMVPWDYIMNALPIEAYDLAFVITGEPCEPEIEYGDAPEGSKANPVIAYPSLGVNGWFPTCITCGPATWIQHGLGWAHFVMPGAPQMPWDPELDGDAGLCPPPGAFPPYDVDECFMDGDAGLMFPEPFTINAAGNVVPCPTCNGTSLGQTCQTAVWGVNADIWIVNNMPVDGYVNVLADWDQNGSWAGSSPCPFALAPEHILVNWSVPMGYNGPLSGLAPPNFLIGPNPGYVWTRFTITEQPVLLPWDGSGSFEDGETEDYLLYIEPPQPEIDFGDAPDNPFIPGYPTLAINNGANHTIGGPWMGNTTDVPDPEPDGQPTPAATGDDLDGNDDEDGLIIPTLTAGQAITFPLEVNDTAGVGGNVQIWIDYNINNNWEHPGEQAYSGFLPVGIHAITINVPATALPGTSFARARISTAGGLTPGGPATDGEVEDTEVYIEPPLPEPKPLIEHSKWSQPPIEIDPLSETPVYSGWDEVSFRESFEPEYWRPVADDFRCLGNMPITSLHWWGSYFGWMEPGIMPGILPIGWKICFWSNVPADPTSEPDYSYPLELLWQINVGANRVAVEEVGRDSYHDFYPPDTCYQYTLQLEPNEYFWQYDFNDLTKDNVFWLSIAAIYDPNDEYPMYPWGWKTRPWHWMDDAVRFWWDGPLEPGIVLDPFEIEPIEDPLYYESVDVAFELDTDPNYIKWEQHYTGIRHWPHYEDIPSWAEIWDADPAHFVAVADDWPCDSNKPVTAIVWWGSYLEYYFRPCQGEFMRLPEPPAYFWISIWTDVPATPGIPGSFSHPNDLIWQYNVYNYDEVLVGYDKHYDPTGETGSEPVFRYSWAIPEPNWFWQEQDEAVYWLMIVAIYENHYPPYEWGWTLHKHVYNDDAVYGWPLASSPEVWEWYEVYDQNEDSADMSFILYTDPNAEPPELDFGDAPDRPYPTLLPLGARHIITGPWLGPVNDAPDSEADGQPDPQALGDDNDGNDDEDGVTIPPLTQGVPTIVTVEVSDPAGLGGIVELWIDFDGSGSWEAAELVFGGNLPPGVHLIPVMAPLGSVVGQTFARCRISTNGTGAPTGLARDGEVEDHEVKIVEGLDFGDAPDPPYPTLLLPGARHVIVPGVMLGASIDAELDGQPDAAATGDDNDGNDDEDGVVFTSLLVPGQQATVDVTASVPGMLNAWIDYDDDGDWSDAIDQVFTNVALTGGGVTDTLTFTVPASATANTDTFARFRFNTAGGLSYDGAATDGEVEDYMVHIEYKVKWSQPPEEIEPGTYFGWDEPSVYGWIQIVADDWPCENQLPVSDIHWWGSYYEWFEFVPPPFPLIGFHIGIWTDVPAGVDRPWSHPGIMIWEYHADIAEVHEEFVAWDFHPDHPPETCFKYDLQLPDEAWFWQDPNENNIYWLSISAIYEGPVPDIWYWGWKTRPHFFMDDAVRIWFPTAPIPGDPFIEGEPIEDPPGTSWDMAFELTTQECLIGGNAGPLEYNDWVNWGYPKCWCYPRQCRGDIDGLKIGFWRVNAADLALFRAAFFKTDPQLAMIPNGICSDLDHIKVGFWRVNAADLAIFRTYFFQMDPLVPLCDQPPIYTGPYNFWTSP